MCHATPGALHNGCIRLLEDHAAMAYGVASSSHVAFLPSTRLHTLLMMILNLQPHHSFPGCTCLSQSHLCGAGLACDVAVGSAGARFKSNVLGLLNRLEPRFGQLVRLVKAWAKAHDCNSPADGTFNTFALCLMVSSSI